LRLALLQKPAKPTNDNSPPIHRWGHGGMIAFESVKRTAESKSRGAGALTLAMLITSLAQAPQENDPPLDPATVREQATLPPGYTVFSVGTAERNVRKNYPFIKRLSKEPIGVALKIDG